MVEFLNCCYNKAPPWCVHLIVVRRFQYASDPEIYTSGSTATGRASLAGQVEGKASDEERHNTGARSSIISSDLMHRANDVQGGSDLYSNRHDQSGLNGRCTAMWKANGKTTTLLLFWTISCKNRDTVYCEMLPLETKQSGGKLLPPIGSLGVLSLEEVSHRRHYDRKEYKEQKENHSYKI